MTDDIIGTPVGETSIAITPKSIDWFDSAKAPLPAAAVVAEDPNTYKFKKPFVFEGETYQSITFDFDSLTGADLTGAQKYYGGKGNFAVLPAYDMGYCAIIAAIAAAKPYDFFGKVSAKDFVAVTQRATRFLTEAD